MTNLANGDAGLQHLDDTAEKILQAGDPKDLPSVDDRVLALGWASALLKERADNGDEVADGLLSALVVVGSGAPIADILRELSYLEQRRANTSTTTNPLGTVPPPPPVGTVPAPKAATPAPPVAQSRKHNPPQGRQQRANR